MIGLSERESLIPHQCSDPLSETNVREVIHGKERCSHAQNLAMQLSMEDATLYTFLPMEIYPMSLTKHQNSKLKGAHFHKNLSYQFQ